LAPFCIVSTRLRHPPLTKSGYKKGAVSDAPEAWFCGCSFKDFSLVSCLKTLPTLAGQGESETDKLKSFR
jgi:hypothetical protein